MEKLFSYGTLQQKKVQEETFGRTLNGVADTLRGYRVSTVRIRDEAVIRKSGLEHHPILVKTGNAEDSVPGTVFEVTVEELKRADQYEVDEYTRIPEVFESGIKAWVYVAAEGIDEAHASESAPGTCDANPYVTLSSSLQSSF